MLNLFSCNFFYLYMIVIQRTDYHFFLLKKNLFLNIKGIKHCLGIHSLALVELIYTFIFFCVVKFRT